VHDCPRRAEEGQHSKCHDETTDFSSPRGRRRGSAWDGCAGDRFLRRITIIDRGQMGRLEHCRDKLAAFKMPTAVVIVEAIPKRKR
jgi:hypothetical protein